MTAPTPDGVDPQLVEAIQQCLEAENNGTGRIPLIIGPFSAYAAVIGLQLAWRHPQMPSHIRQALHDLGRQFESVFAGGPLAAHLATGWETGLDQPPADQPPAG